MRDYQTNSQGKQARRKKRNLKRKRARTQKRREQLAIQKSWEALLEE